MLFGMNPENDGFSKQEFLESFQLFNKTVIQPIQNQIVKAFDKIFDAKDTISFNQYVIWDDKIINVPENNPIENE
jgi:hypothetical protein